MDSNKHVIDISTNSNRNSQTKTLSQLSIAAEKALSVYLCELNASLKDMLSSVDDHLFDKSGKSEDSSHFAALRTLRMKKQGLLSLFEQEVINHFRQTLGTFDDSEFKSFVETEVKLSLVEEDALEESIAIDSMITRARKENELALKNLRQRLDVLLPAKAVTEELNPFEPSFICSAFSRAMQPIQLGVEFKLVLYKYFERKVIQQLDLIYQKVNDYFIEHGILPELKNESVKRAGRTVQTRTNERQRHLKDTCDSNELLNLLGDLLSEIRSDTGVRVAQQVNTHELVGLLSNISTPSSENFCQGEGVIDVRGQLVNQLPATIGGQVGKGALGQFNDDMIDVVTMLFDFILDDENLHSEVKAIIARLQIPILKVGLIDRTFFSNRKHSARLLLNELAHAGLSWDPSDAGSEPMLNKIKSAAEKIYNDFSDNVQVFDQILEDFLCFKHEHGKRAKIFEKRTREAEEGKARAEGARAKVNQEITRLCFKKHVPEVVRQLLKKVWVHVMFLERLRADEEAWDKVCRLAKMLVWSVQPIKDKARLDKLAKNVPILIKNLKLGFSKVSFSHIESSGLLDRLEDTHHEIIKSAREYIEEESRDKIIRLKPVSSFEWQPERPIQTDVQEQVEKEEFQTIEIEEVAFSAEETGQSLNTQRAKIEITEESCRVVESLHAGSWFELKLEKEFKRCKLAARITSSGKFIFVNRSGVKVAEYLNDELAAEFQLGNLKILDDEALFDRALESVISNLRAMKAQA